MKRILTAPAFMLVAALTMSAQNPVGLKCEYLVNPLGIDEPAPRFTWHLDDARAGIAQSSWRIVVSQNRESVCEGKGESWDSGIVQSDNILAEYAGEALKSFTKYWWRVECINNKGEKLVSDPACFETAMMSEGDWKGCWIADGQDVSGNGIEEPRAPYFRKVIDLDRPVRSARAYICAAGLYELSINGGKVGDHRLDPMFTRYDRRNLYLTHDITDYLKEGENVIGIILGNGWYNHQPHTASAAWFFDRAPWRDRPAFCMDLRIEYEDGSTAVVPSDTTWRTSLGPITRNNIYTAEQYDARLEMPGWDEPGFNASGWKNSINRSAPSSKIVSQQMHPIRDVETINVRSVRKIDDRTYLFDFGRNFSGVTEFSADVSAGTTFRLRHGEYLIDGMLRTENITEHYLADEKDPMSVDIVTFAGKGNETFRARFNYKGFRYVEVTCDRPVDLSADNLKAYFMHTDFPQVGSVETSSELINKLWKTSCVSYLSNFFGYPTDCPHREKNGWTGDAGYACQIGLYNYDAITLYEKWIKDHQDEQQPNGLLPCIIPTSGWGYHYYNGLDWTSTIATIPWNVYLFYGDSRLLESAYDNIRRYVDHVTELYPGGLTDWGLGDWVPIKTKTPVELTSSVYYFNDVKILAKAAKLFGKDDDFKKYSSLADKIQKAVNDKYLDRQTGRYAEGSQTAQCVPLYWGIVPEDMKAKAASSLAGRIKADGNHMDVGLLGTKAILDALSDNGYSDLAYTIASNTTYPSWGYWMVNGATTFYEHWRATWDEQHRPSSLNHIMFGEVNAWFYRALGGIRPDPEQPGFKHILLQPKFVKGLDKARIEHKCPYGTIVSCWQRKGREVIYEVTIPAGAVASFSVPAGMKIKETECEGRKIVLTSDDGTYTIPSGTYKINL